MSEEWQPARIAPASNDDFHPRQSSKVGSWELDQGKIIRIRPTWGRTPNCDGQHFEVHPEDAPLLGGNLGGILCEHQILTD